MTENTEKTMNTETEIIEDELEPGVHMNTDDCTETIVLTIADAMNAAQAIRNYATETLDRYSPKGNPIDNANLCSLALSKIGRDADDLRIMMCDALNEYIPARAQFEYCDDTDTLHGALSLATQAAAMAQNIAEAQGIKDSGIMDAIYKAKSYCTDARARLFCAAHQAEE